MNGPHQSDFWNLVLREKLQLFWCNEKRNNIMHRFQMMITRRFLQTIDVTFSNNIESKVHIAKKK
jgi:hypothetical protein